VTASWEREATVETAGELAELIHDQLPFHLADPEGPLLARLIAEDAVVYRPEVLRHFAGGGDDGLVDQRAALARSDTPVLVVSGVHDRTTPADSAHALATVLRAAEEVVLGGSAHFLPYEEPEAFLAALRRFLARV
jgi:pimeloyl-ACP methyl ester carboxylesterase